MTLCKMRLGLARMASDGASEQWRTMWLMVDPKSDRACNRDHGFLMKGGLISIVKDSSRL